MLKKWGGIIILVLCYNNTFAQFSEQLSKTNESVAFAFQLKNKKWVSVCREKNDKYLVYRFGTKDKIELTYPQLPDSSSWQRFSFTYYSRGGGKQNAAMDYAYLSFSNNNILYEVYDTWAAEDNIRYIGVNVSINQRKMDMKGLLKTRKNYLQSLSDSPVKLQEEQ